MPGSTISETRIVLFPVPLSVSRQKIKDRLLVLCLLAFFAGFSSCKAEGAFAEELSGASLSFYRGLLAKAGEGPAALPDADTASAGASETAADLFESALESPNPLIRDAAAEQLILPVLNRDTAPDRLLKLQSRQKPPFTDGETTLRAALFYALGRYGDIGKLYAQTGPETAPEPPQARPPDGKPWDEALRLLAETRLRPGDTRETVRLFLFGAVPGDAVRWALGEIRRLDSETLTGAENAAIEGRLSAARSAFSGGLILFRVVLDQEPDLFFRYPELLTDLGRCLQFAAGGNEAIEILQNMVPGTFSRYYFMGRISRQRGQYRQSREFFTQALPLAPDALQSDACIWYILDTALTEGISESPALVKSYIPRWHDDPYFSDILDRLSRYLAANRQWEAIAELLPLIREGSDRASVAKYAYITARAIMLGYTNQTAGMDEAARFEAARPYFLLAYEAGEFSYYYRALSASFLDLPLRLLPEPAGAGAETETGNFPHPTEMAFLRGFFQTGASAHITAYLQKMAGDLSVPELRALAGAFREAGRHQELIRLVSEYMSREDYEPDRRDLELYYPRPFLGPVEENARAAALPPALLFGLIRTESAFQADIRSRAGAMGLTQLMPATAAEMAGRIKRQGGQDYTENGPPDLQNPETNIHIGAVYLSYLMNRLEHPLLAILAYNGGMNRVRRWYAASGRPGPLPGDIFLETIEYAETREYGRRVLSAAAAYGYLFYDVSMGRLFTDICK